MAGNSSSTEAELDENDALEIKVWDSTSKLCSLALVDLHLSLH